MPEQIHSLDDAVKKPDSVWITDWCADIWEPTMAHHLPVRGRHSRDPTVWNTWRGRRAAYVSPWWGPRAERAAEVPLWLVGRALMEDKKTV